MPPYPAPIGQTRSVCAIKYFYRTFLQEQAFWVITKKDSVKAAICIFRRPYVLSPNPAFLQNQRDESSCHSAARRGNHAAPNEGKLVGLPSDAAIKRPVSPMGQAGRVAATLQKMGIGGCGLAAPSIDEGEPAMVRRASLIML